MLLTPQTVSPMSYRPRDSYVGMSHDDSRPYGGSTYYARTEEDARDLPWAGLPKEKSANCLTVALARREATGQKKSERVQGCEQSKLKMLKGHQLIASGVKPVSEVDTRTDPASFQKAAGAPPKSDEFFDERPAKILVSARMPTDPITHFFATPDNRRRGKRTFTCGQEGVVRGQTWTWMQDAEAIASMGLGARHRGDEKVSIGADGSRVYNLFGAEDLLQPATQPYLKCERPVRPAYIEHNDKEQMPYHQREFPSAPRSVHQYWASDDMWAIFKSKDSARMVNDDGSSDDESKENSPPKLGYGRRRIIGIPYHMSKKARAQREKEARSQMEFRCRFERARREKEARERARSPDIVSAPGATPASEKGAALSMASPSMDRFGMAARIATERSSISGESSPKLGSSKSAPFIPQRREGVSVPSNRSEPTPGSQARSATPCSATPRSNVSGRSSLSMTPQVLSRRNMMGTQQGPKSESGISQT